LPTVGPRYYPLEFQRIVSIAEEERSERQRRSIRLVIHSIQLAAFIAFWITSLLTSDFQALQQGYGQGIQNIRADTNGAS